MFCKWSLIDNSQSLPPFVFSAKGAPHANGTRGGALRRGGVKTAVWDDGCQ